MVYRYIAVNASLNQVKRSRSYALRWFRFDSYTISVLSMHVLKFWTFYSARVFFFCYLFFRASVYTLDNLRKVC
jgi:hypothetical protein